MKNINSAIAPSRLKLIIIAGTRFILSLLIVVIILFIPAGSLSYWNGWLYLTALFVPMLFALIYLIIKDPVLLQKRMNIKEKDEAQKRYVKVSIIFLIITFIIPGLDYRFKWSDVPQWLVILAAIVMVLGYIMFVIVMMENSYASRVIEIQPNQKLIDHGLYSIIRHPMYLAASILYGASPIVLGSYYAMIPMMLLPIILAYRIINEEKLLIEGLEGYKDYMKKVKYRLIPHIW